MSYTRACWVEKNKDYERVIPSSWVDTARKVVHWPNGLQVKRAYENLETPKPGWKQFSLIKCKMCGTKEDCEGCTDYTTTEEQPTAPKEKIISEKEKVYSNILPTFPTQNPRDIPLAKYQQSKPQHSNRISQQFNSTKIKESSSKHSKSNPVEPPPPRVVHSQCSSLPRSRSRSNSQSRSHSRSRSRLQSKSHSQSKSYSRSQLHYSRSWSNSDSSRSSYSNSNVTSPGLVEVSPIVYKSSCIQRKDAVRFRRRDFPMDDGDYQYTVIKLLTKQLENQDKILQHFETTVDTVVKGNLPAKFLEVNQLLDFDKILHNDEDMSNQLVARLSRVGGTTLKENIKNILESLISYKVLAGFNMKGNNRNEKNKQEVQDKLSFEKLKLFELIIESVLTKRSEATISDIKAEVQRILRYAPSKVVFKDGGLLPKDHIET